MLTLDLLRHLAISQVVLLGFSALIYHRDIYLGKLLALFAICMTCYLAFPLLDLSQNKTAAFVIGRLGFATPAVLWLIAYTFFVDRSRIPLWIWSSIVVYMGLRAIGSIYFYVDPTVPIFSVEYMSFYMAPYLLRLGMCGHMLFLALSGHDHDLVELRRKIRVPFVLILGGIFTLMTIDNSLSLTLHMSKGVPVTIVILERAIEFFIFPATLAINVLLFRITFEIFGVISPKEVSISVKSSRHDLDDKDTAIRDNAILAMEADKLYVRSGLTMGDFAKHLDVQEYKLRSIINQHLGYNNFSHFLNEYRIREAKVKLLNTKDSIFNIGLDVGYTSLSSFHKAFKDSLGVTPKEYRILNRGASKVAGVSFIPLQPKSISDS